VQCLAQEDLFAYSHRFSPLTHVLHSSMQARHWKATYSFPRCARDLFATGLQLVGLPGASRNEPALRAGLSRYGAVTSAQVIGDQWLAAGS
jgi:hypothetical protein